MKLELGPRPESKLEISLGRSPKAEILKHNNRHGTQRTARGEEGKGAARRLILAEDKQLDARLLKLCNFSASNCRQRHFLLWFGFHLSTPTLSPLRSPLYPWLTMQMSWLQAGGCIGLPGTPTLTLIAIVCGISTCLYRSQRPGLLLLLLLLPHLICHAPSPSHLAAGICLCCSSALALHLSCLCKKLFASMAAHRRRPLLFWHFAFCLWQRHNQKGQAAAPLRAQLLRYWQAITTETPAKRNRLSTLDSQLSSVLCSPSCSCCCCLSYCFDSFAAAAAVCARM